MIHWLMANVVCPFFGTIAFAVMFNVPKRFYMSCGVIGTLGWLVYCVAVQPTSAPVASFFGTFVVVLISRMLTVRMKCPITMFMIPGIFPLIPGASVYYMAYDLVMSETKQAGQSGFLALKIAFGIVLGIVAGVSFPREIFTMEYWRNRRQNRKENKKQKA